MWEIDVEREDWGEGWRRTKLSGLVAILFSWRKEERDGGLRRSVMGAVDSQG